MKEEEWRVKTLKRRSRLFEVVLEFSNILTDLFWY